MKSTLKMQKMQYEEPLLEIDDDIVYTTEEDFFKISNQEPEPDEGDDWGEIW